MAWYVIDRAYRRGDLDRVWHALPLALLVFAEFTAVALWHNTVKTGSLWDSGYQIKNGVFSGDLFAGLYGLLLSTGKSAFLYSPPLVLAVLGAPVASLAADAADSAIHVGDHAAAAFFLELQARATGDATKAAKLRAAATPHLAAARDHERAEDRHFSTEGDE